MKQLKVAAVSYRNTRPLLYGWEQGIGKGELELVVDYPARIAAMLESSTVDVGLIPVAVLAQHPGWTVVGDYGIAADGEVASVCLFSQVPLDEVEEVYLDYQSRTSVQLCRLLLRHYWKRNVVFLKASGDEYMRGIRGRRAGLVIGDRALEFRPHAQYIYDLGAAWKDFTGLPFVFAAWIARKPLEPHHVALINSICAYGLERLDEVVAAHPYAAYDLRQYYGNNIRYRLDGPKREGMNLFLEKLAGGTPTDIYG